MLPCTHYMPRTHAECTGKTEHLVSSKDANDCHYCYCYFPEWTESANFWMHAELNNMETDNKKKSHCKENAIEMPEQSLGSMMGPHLPAVPYVSFWRKKSPQELMFVIRFLKNTALWLHVGKGNRIYLPHKSHTQETEIHRPFSQSLSSVLSVSTQRTWGRKRKQLLLLGTFQ